jgi:hypothetical protein
VINDMRERKLVQSGFEPAASAPVSSSPTGLWGFTRVFQTSDEFPRVLTGFAGFDGFRTGFGRVILIKFQRLCQSASSELHGVGTTHPHVPSVRELQRWKGEHTENITDNKDGPRRRT